MRAVEVIAVCSLAIGLILVGEVGGASVGEAELKATVLTFSDAGSQPADLPGLACVQDSLGGVQAFARVTSLRTTSDTRPLASTGFRPLPGTREIDVVFPDQYRRVDIGRVPNGGRLDSTIGFNRRELLSSPRGPDGDVMMLVARQDFVRQVLMRVPRTLAGVTLSQRVTHDAGRERIAIDAMGPDGLVATLLADRKTCMPVALQYGAGGRSGSVAVRVDLSTYRKFDGLLFPTVFTTSYGSNPHSEERVTHVELNAPGANTYFAVRQAGRP